MNMTEEEIKSKVSSYDSTQFDQMRDFVRGLYPGTVLDSKEGCKRIRFLCPCEGEPRFKIPNQQKRSSKKCGCNYMIYVILKNNRYLIKKCNMQHNDHDLETESTVLKAPKIRRFYQKKDHISGLFLSDSSDTSSESSGGSPRSIYPTFCGLVPMNGYPMQMSTASAFKHFIHSEGRHQTNDVIAALMELSNPNRIKISHDLESLNTSHDSTLSVQDSGALTPPTSSVAENFDLSSSSTSTSRNMTPTFEGALPSEEVHAFKRKFELMC